MYLQGAPKSPQCACMRPDPAWRLYAEKKSYEAPVHFLCDYIRIPIDGSGLPNQRAIGLPPGWFGNGQINWFTTLVIQKKPDFYKQGRIHGYPSRVRVGRDHI